MVSCNRKCSGSRKCVNVRGHSRCAPVRKSGKSGKRNSTRKKVGSAAKRNSRKSPARSGCTPKKVFKSFGKSYPIHRSSKSGRFYVNKKDGSKWWLKKKQACK